MRPDRWLLGYEVGKAEGIIHGLRLALRICSGERATLGGPQDACNRIRAAIKRRRKRG